MQATGQLWNQFDLRVSRTTTLVCASNLARFARPPGLQVLPSAKVSRLAYEGVEVGSLEINHIHFVFRKPVEICHAMTTRFCPSLLSVRQIPRQQRARHSSVFKRRLFPVYSNRSCSSRESRIGRCRDWQTWAGKSCRSFAREEK